MNTNRVFRNGGGRVYQGVSRAFHQGISPGSYAKLSGPAGLDPFNKIRVNVVGQDTKAKRLAGNAGILTMHGAHVQSEHSADVYYLLTHVAIEVLATHPVYASAVDKFGEEEASRSEWASQKTERFQIQFGPAGGIASTDNGLFNTFGRMLMVLAGIPIEGGVNIENLSRNPMGAIQKTLAVGRGYELNLPGSPSVFPDPFVVAKKISQKFSNNKAIDVANYVMDHSLENIFDDNTQALDQLDPKRGDELLARAKNIQKLCTQREYLYLVYDKMGTPPWVVESVFTPKFNGKRLRNCWGFITDLFHGW